MLTPEAIALALTANDRTNLVHAQEGISVSGRGFFASWRRLIAAGLVTRIAWGTLYPRGYKIKRGPYVQGNRNGRQRLTHSMAFRTTGFGDEVVKILRPEWFERYESESDENGYVPFNADRRLGQNQYASRYADGRVGSANLGAGLRWKDLDSGSYHDIMIHRDDLAVFHLRVERYQDDVAHGREPVLP